MAVTPRNPNSFNARRSLSVNGKEYFYYSLAALAEAGIGHVARLPYSIRILLENLLRHEDCSAVKKEDIATVANWNAKAVPDK